MNLTKAARREKKNKRERYGHTVDGRSVFEIRRIQKKRSLEKKQELELKYKDE